MKILNPQPTAPPGKQKTLSEIALYYVWTDQLIKKCNCNDIAQKFDHNSGAKLMQHYNYYLQFDLRTGFDTKRKTQNKKLLFEKVIEWMKKEGLNCSKAQSELKLLNDNYIKNDV